MFWVVWKSGLIRHAFRLRQMITASDSSSAQSKLNICCNDCDDFSDGVFTHKSHCFPGVSVNCISRLSQLRFRGLLLYNEGWPLCIHDKVVLQLSPLHKVRLKQGDVYLQIVPLGRKSAKLVIKCLSASGHPLSPGPCWSCSQCCFQ